MMTILYIFGTMSVITAIFLTYAIMTAEPYPDDLEQEDNERIKKLFDEHKKSQK